MWLSIDYILKKKTFVQKTSFEEKTNSFAKDVWKCFWIWIFSLRTHLKVISASCFLVGTPFLNARIIVISVPLKFFIVPWKTPSFSSHFIETDFPIQSINLSIFWELSWIWIFCVANFFFSSFFYVVLLLKFCLILLFLLLSLLFGQQKNKRMKEIVVATVIGMASGF